MVEAFSYILSPEAEQAEQSDDAQSIIVAKLMTDTPTVSVSKAVMRQDLKNVPVLMFRNSAHGELSVVYRREDDNFGWIDPKNPV